MDEKLVEALGSELVRAVGEWYGQPRAPWEKFYQFLGERALSAISDLGTHWVAPREATAIMNAVGIRMTPWPEDPETVFAQMRDVYLASRRSGDG